MQVWRQSLPIQPTFELDLPFGTQLLRVGQDTKTSNWGAVWFLVDRDVATVIRQRRRFAIVGTGFDEVQQSDVYVGSFYAAGGKEIYHLFERKS